MGNMTDDLKALLRDTPDQTARELAEKVGIERLPYVRKVLRQMHADGLVTAKLGQEPQPDARTGKRVRNVARYRNT